MIIRNVAFDDLRAATEEIGDIRMEAEDRSSSRRRIYKVRLFPVGDKRRAAGGRLRGSDGRIGTGPRRRLNSVSWEGYRDWFRALYARCPLADVTTTYYGNVRYRNRADFELSYRDTGHTRVKRCGDTYQLHHNQYDPAED